MAHNFIIQRQDVEAQYVSCVSATVYIPWWSDSQILSEAPFDQVLPFAKIVTCLVSLA